MPAAAFALLGFFIAVALVAGGTAWWIVGPRRAWALALPILAAFGALYLFGHLLEWSVGPTLTLFGFDVALLFDLVLAVVAAALAAIVQRIAGERLTPGEAAARR